MTPRPISYLVTEEHDLETLGATLRAELRLTAEPATESTRTWLDSFDWRLWQAGMELYLEQCAGEQRLCWRRREEHADACGLAVDHAPRFVWDLPSGPVRERLEEVLEMRALLPVAVVRSQVQTLRRHNRDGKLTLQVTLEQNRLLRPGKRAPVALDRRLTVTPVKGYDEAWVALTRFVQTHTNLPDAEPLLATALAALDARPGSYSSKLRLRLDPDQRADAATKQILHALLDTMEQNEAGIREDIDSEFLHDFRVAVRRSRTALSQIKNVFPQRVLERFRPQFNWLGQITGPTRDMDVYLLKFGDYRAALAPEIRDDLDPLHAFLERHRAEEQARLVQALGSVRYRRLVEGWRKYLDAPVPRYSSLHNAMRPVKQVADHRIWKMYRRVLHEGEAITDASPDEDLHDMRKSCKKLRYLMEFFQSLYPTDAIRQSIKTLKALQENLGDFQDLSVQIDTLRAFSQQMVDEGEVPPQTLIAMGILVEQLTARQHQERDEFAIRFAGFSQIEHRRQFRTLFKPQPREERLVG